MWNSLITAFGAAVLAGCQPSSQPTVSVTQVSPALYSVMIETPRWEKYSDEVSKSINLVDQDKNLANERAAGLCIRPNTIEITERRIVPCDWVCDGHPPYTTSTTWLVSCKSASE
jgi:hypothetical protein